MSSEITVTAALSYVNVPQNIAQVQLAITPPGIFTITGRKFAQGTFNVPTTAGGTAIPIGSLPTLGWAFIKNNDATNYVEILSAVSGTTFIRLQPGEACVFKFAPSITAPAALAHTLASDIEYLFLEI